jgi:hypothetical protein
LEFIELFIDVALVFGWLLLDELVHEGRHGFSHRNTSNFIGS